jgi:capsular polysaccharide biosynthesis protein
MNEQDRAVAWPVGVADDLPERLWAGEGAGSVDSEEGASGDPTIGVATVGFLLGALGRRRKLWLTLGIVGFVLGTGMYLHLAPSYPASTTVLLVYGPNQDPQQQVFTEAAIAQSTEVASAVVSQLGLSESVGTFLSSYQVTQASDQVLQITLSAPTSGDAVAWTNAVAQEFLKVSAQYAQTEQTQQEDFLNGQITAAQAKLTSVNAQLTQAQSDSASHTTISQLTTQQTDATNALSQIKTSAVNTELDTRVATEASVQGSKVVNPAALVHKSKVKTILTYIGGGLFGGFGLGIAIVVIGALLSDKLRRRDDVAYALGVPVGLSVGRLRPRRLPGLGGKGARARDRDMRRLVGYLRKAIPSSSRGPQSLAVVAMGDPGTVAEAVVSLATEAASQGTRVLLADLSDGTHAARLLGSREPGVRKIDARGSRLILVVPDPADVAPVGPLPGRRGLMTGAQPAEELASVARDANLLISLVTLDPAHGGDHVATWATSAVAVVTGGQSSALFIRSNAEMVQLAGTRLRSAVLVGADSRDESLGAWDRED